MSDHFYEALDQFCMYDIHDPEMNMYRSGRCKFIRDPLYYHREIRFIRIEKETSRAFLFKLSSTKELWVAKSLCKSLDREENSVFIWRGVHIT